MKEETIIVQGSMTRPVRSIGASLMITLDKYRLEELEINIKEGDLLTIELMRVTKYHEE